MGSAGSCRCQSGEFDGEEERDEAARKLVEDLRLHELSINRETWTGDPDSKKKQMMRDFGRFVTHIQSTVFNPVQEEELESNLTTIQNLLRRHLQIYLDLSQEQHIDDAVEAILDSIFNTLRRGEVWGAVYERCTNFGKLHALPTTSRIPTKVEFFSQNRVVAQIGTTVQLWQEDENFENEIVVSITCRTVTTFAKSNAGGLGPPEIQYDLMTRYFSEEEKRRAKQRVIGTSGVPEPLEKGEPTRPSE